MSTKLNPTALAAILGASVGVAGAQASDPPREREEARSDRRAGDAVSQQAKVTQSRQAKIESGDRVAADRPATNAESSRQYKLESVPAHQLKIESPSRQIKIGDQPSRQIKIDGVDGERAEQRDEQPDRRPRRPQ